MEKGENGDPEIASNQQQLKGDRHAVYLCE